MDRKWIPIALFAVCLIIPMLFVLSWLGEADENLKSSTDSASTVAVASASEDQYCTPTLKKVLRRVAGACGLLQEGSRGCKPGDAKTVAAVSGDDFNMLFKPLDHRAAIIQFDAEQTSLDAEAQSLVEGAWSDQRGASFFFVVARASTDGSPTLNQELSQKRAEAVLSHLETKFQDPDMKKEVGLLWLGEEYAQLGEDFCSWKRSRGSECTAKDINRSAFVAWIDCAI